jgi:hypothetical protein
MDELYFKLDDNSQWFTDFRAQSFKDLMNNEIIMRLFKEFHRVIDFTKVCKLDKQRAFLKKWLEKNVANAFEDIDI